MYRDSLGTPGDLKLIAMIYLWQARYVIVRFLATCDISTSFSRSFLGHLAECVKRYCAAGQYFDSVGSFNQHSSFRGSHNSSSNWNSSGVSDGSFSSSWFHNYIVIPVLTLYTTYQSSPLYEWAEQTLKYLLDTDENASSSTTTNNSSSSNTSKRRGSMKGSHGSSNNTTKVKMKHQNSSKNKSKTNVKSTRSRSGKITIEHQNYHNENLHRIQAMKIYKQMQEYWDSYVPPAQLQVLLVVVSMIILSLIFFSNNTTFVINGGGVPGQQPNMGGPPRGVPPGSQSFFVGPQHVNNNNNNNNNINNNRFMNQNTHQFITQTINSNNVKTKTTNTHHHHVVHHQVNAQDPRGAGGTMTVNNVLIKNVQSNLLNSKNTNNNNKNNNDHMASSSTPKKSYFVKGVAEAVPQHHMHNPNQHHHHHTNHINMNSPGSGGKHTTNNINNSISGNDISFYFAEPSLFLFFIYVAMFGTLSSLFFYGRVILPFPDLISGGHAIHDISCSKERDSHKSHHSGSSSGFFNKSQKENPWAESYKSIVQENRMCLWIKVIVLRTLENVYVNFYLPQTRYACLLTEHCYRYPTIWERHSYYFLSKFRPSSLDPSHTSVYDVIHVDRVVEIFILVSIILVSVLILLAQAGTLDRVYLSTLGYLAGEQLNLSRNHNIDGVIHSFSTSNSTLDNVNQNSSLSSSGRFNNNNSNSNSGNSSNNNRRGKNKTTNKQQQQQQQDYDLMLNMNTSSNNSSFSFTSFSFLKSANVTDRCLRIAHFLFSNEFGHVSTSTLLSVASKIHFYFVFILLNVCGLYHTMDYDYEPIVFIILSNAFSGYGIVNIGLVDCYEIRTIAKELSSLKK